MIAWRKRVGEQKAQEITTEVAGVGTRMHKYPEDYVETGDWPQAEVIPMHSKPQYGNTTQKQCPVHHEIWGSEVNSICPSDVCRHYRS